MSDSSSPAKGTSRLPTCRCGHTRNHHAVHAKPKYGFMGIFQIIFFPSSKPKEVTFQCTRCGEVLEVSRNPEVLRRFN